MPFYLLLFQFLTMTPEEDIRIFDWPIPYDSTRIALSLEYMKTRHGIEKESPTIDPKMIVVHWTAIPTLQGSYNAFAGTYIPGFRPELKGISPVNVSIQFLVAQNGTIYRLLPETFFARHVIGLNHCAIGIENVGGGKNTPLTQEQFEANVKLITYLKNKYNAIEYLIGHHEYQEFRGHELWKETDPNYLTQKSDPGKKFMRRLRKEVNELQLKGKPEKLVVAGNDMKIEK